MKIKLLNEDYKIPDETIIRKVGEIVEKYGFWYPGESPYQNGEWSMFYSKKPEGEFVTKWVIIKIKPNGEPLIHVQNADELTVEKALELNEDLNAAINIVSQIKPLLKELY